MHPCDRRWNVAAVGVLVLCLTWAAPAGAEQQVVVTTVEGRQIQGALVEETEERVVLRIAGIPAEFARDRIESIEVLPSPEQYYRDRRAEIDDDDLDARYALAFELYERHALDLAMQEITSLGERFPESQRVQRLRRVLEHRQRLAEQGPAEPRDRAQSPAAELPEELPRLSQEQINRIRVYEIDLAEEPRVQIPRPTLLSFLDAYAGEPGMPATASDRGAFLRAPGHEQLAAMFDVQAREFYGDVMVRRDPPALMDFRQRLHRQYVLRYCGTSECHGGEDAPGDLRLLRRAASRTDTVYTNFYILHAYPRSADGRDMIDRDRPEQSLLLQYGLARDAADTPHPEVPGWRPQFRNKDDRFFEQYAGILERLWRPAPGYGIDYQPPGRSEPEPEPEEGDTNADDAQPDAEEA